MNQSNQDVNSTVHVPPTSEEEDPTSSEVGEVGDNNVRPITPIPNETRTDDTRDDVRPRTYEEGSIQTQENTYHQILFENMRRDKMISRESKHNRTVCSPSDADEVENTQSFTVPDIEEEPSVVDILEENLKLKKRNKTLEQYCHVLRVSNNIKDVELKLKDEEINKEKNLQAKHDEDMKKIKDEYARLEEDVKKSKDEKARLEEDYRDVHEAFRIEYVSDSKNVGELKDKIEILEKGMKKTKEMEDENARLKDDKARLEEEKKCMLCFSEEKKYIVLPCCHYGICENCFNHEKFDKKKCPHCRTRATDFPKVFNQ